MSKSDVILQVAAIHVPKMEVGKEYEFSTEIDISEGVNCVRLSYPLAGSVYPDVRLRIRVFEIDGKTDLLRTFPRTVYGRDSRFYIDSRKARRAKLKYYIQLTECDSGEDDNRLLLCPVPESRTLTRLQDAVDRVFVVNLPSRSDKRAKMSARLDFHDIPHTFESAVDGRSEDVYKAWFRKVSKKTFNSLESKLGRPELYYCGAWGYNETYISILRSAITERLESIAIFDDDTLFHRDFISKFDSLTRTPEYKQSSLIYLGCRFLDVDKSTLPEYVTEDMHVVGSYAIILKSDAFKPILEYLERREHVVDGVPLRHLFGQGKAVALRDPLVLPECENGDIRADRDTHEIYAQQNWDISDFGHDVHSRESYIFEEMSAGVFGRVADFAVLGIKCKNRVGYVKDLINSFIETKSDSVGFRVYVADTSTDEESSVEIQDYLKGLSVPNTTIAYLKFCDGSVTDLSNGILSEIYKHDMRYNPSIFMCDEDIVFLREGWDTSYIRAMRDSEFEHLVFYDTRWRPAAKNKLQKAGRLKNVELHAKADYLSAQGAFFTLTCRLLREVGIYNKSLFPTKGGGHLNYTYRMYAHLGKDPKYIYDIAHSESLIQLQPRESYQSTGADLSLYHQTRVNSERVHATFKERIENLDTCFEMYERVSR
jgi:hypothetical protein